VLAVGALEDEALRRAVEGVEEPVYQGGKQVGVIRKYSDALLMFLLKAARPEKYRENYSIRHDGQSGPIRVQFVNDWNRGGAAAVVDAEQDDGEQDMTIRVTCREPVGTFDATSALATITGGGE
jgi:hypothetical protein